MTHQSQPKNVQEILPLSPTQEGMLFEILRDPGAVGRYDSIQRVSLSGPLDPAAFEAAFCEVALAPDVSRACFVQDSGAGPLQIIRQQVTLPFTLHDWSDRPNFEADLNQLQDSLLATPMALTKAPLMEAILLRQSVDRHELLWRVHHMISDAWSARVVMDDVLARLNGAPRKAPGPAFRDHLARRQHRDRAADTVFFKDHLAGLTEAVLVASPGSGHGKTERIDATIPETTTQAFAALARSERSTLATALCLAWGCCLRRLTGQEDVIFGRVAAGRDPSVPGIERAVGPYLNVVPTRLPLDGTVPVTDALRAAEARLSALRRHEDAALSDALAGLEPSLQSRLPFDTLVSIQGFPPPEQSGLLRVTGTKTRDASGFPLALILAPGADIRVELVYDSTRLHQQTAQDIADLFVRTVEAMAAAPDRPLAQLEGLPFAPVPPAPPLRFASGEIRARAQETPDAVAIKTAEDELSYGALAAQAMDLAAALTASGIGKGDVVPIVADRRPQTVVAMLAVLLSGAAYAPLDPNYPAARNRMVLDALTPKVVLGDLPLEGWDGPVLAPSDPHPADPSFQPHPVEPSDPAYVIFTSGSTGQPKGVVVTQGNLSWTTAARAPTYGDGPKAFLHLSSFAFDSSVVGLYWTLTTGGTLHLAAPRAEQDPAALMALITREGVSHLLCLPRLWSAILAAAPAPASLGTVIVAGEDVTRDLVKQHRGAAPQTRLFNEYGPTEASVWCAAAEIGGLDAAPTIGQAPPGAALDPVDLDGWPLPRGLQGELFVRGAGIAQGYLGQPQGSGGFVAAPVPGYRTGDLGTKGPDGTIRWEGRKDDQVKIRGQRIELGEIEAAAVAAGANSAAAAVLEGRIILAVTQGPADLRERLASRLTPAAQPAAIHDLAELPRFPNQKIDRRAVAALGLKGEAAAPVPAGHFEAVLSEIWSKLLKVPVGPQTNFFDAGGDSLMTIRVLAEAEARGIVLGPADMFETPVLGDLAAVLRRRLDQPLQNEADLRVSVANPSGSLDPVLMIHGSPKFNAAIAAALGPDRPFVFNWSHHLAGEAKLSDRIETMADEAMAALDRIGSDGPCAVGGFSLGAIIALEVAHRLKARGRPVTLLAMVDPSYDIAPPDGGKEAFDIKAIRWIGAAKSVVHLALGRLKGWGRNRRVPHIYRAILPFYRPKAYTGDSLILQNTIKPRNGLAIAAATPTAHREALPYSHLQLLDDSEAIADVATRIVAHLRRLEKETPP